MLRGLTSKVTPEMRPGEVVFGETFRLHFPGLVAVVHVAAAAVVVEQERRLGHQHDAGHEHEC